jgi:hypothetical protein
LTIPSLEHGDLRLRPLELADADQARILFPHWRDRQAYLNAVVPWPYPPTAHAIFYERVALPAMERGEHGRGALFLKTGPGQLIRQHQPDRGEHETAASGSDSRGTVRVDDRGERGVTTFWFEVLKFPVLRVPKAIAEQGIAPHLESRYAGDRDVERDNSAEVAAEIWELLRRMEQAA